MADNETAVATEPSVVDEGDKESGVVEETKEEESRSTEQTSEQTGIETGVTPEEDGKKEDEATLSSAAGAAKEEDNVVKDATDVVEGNDNALDSEKAVTEVKAASDELSSEKEEALNVNGQIEANNQKDESVQESNGREPSNIDLVEPPISTSGTSEFSLQTTDPSQPSISTESTTPNPVSISLSRSSDSTTAPTPLLTPSSVATTSRSVGSIPSLEPPQSPLTQHKPRRLSPLSVEMLNTLERQATACSANLAYMTGSLRSSLHAVTALSLQSMNVYKTSVINTTDTVAQSVYEMHNFITKCQALNEDLKSIEGLSAEIKDIKKALDNLEAISARLIPDTK
eukprot:TRINITY_DN5766_c0_g1_i1.p1 TRINITY_DN5766_c0_g1~~TRINITY_DN5766_c0_g1_i1.p1  ORF type:complete len:342 (+),score=84.18 TRINITY_DN5766_c0_g1_i1:51-1076(+)